MNQVELMSSDSPSHIAIIRAALDQGAYPQRQLGLADLDDTSMLACTVVLLSVAGSDFRYCDSEIQRAYDLLEEQLQMSPPLIYAYIERASMMFEVFGRRALTASAIEYLQIHQSKEFHRELFRMATEIAKADGEIAQPEVGWFRRFVDKMVLTVADCKRALRLSPSSPSAGLATG